MQESYGFTPTETEVLEALSKMSNRKAAGPNNIPLEAYKYLSDENFEHFYDTIISFW